MSTKEQLEDELEKVKKNWTTLLECVSKIQDDTKRDRLYTLLSAQRDRLIVSPASTQHKYVGCYMGGLVKTTLQMIKLAIGVNAQYPKPVSTDSVITCAVLCQVGKIGSEDEGLYLELNSQWHNDRGIMYSLNENLNNIDFSVRSLWWANKYEIPLTEDELVALASMSSMLSSSNQSTYELPVLAHCIQHAYQVVCRASTGKKSVLDS